MNLSVMNGMFGLIGLIGVIFIVYLQCKSLIIKSEPPSTDHQNDPTHHLSLAVGTDSPDIIIYENEEDTICCKFGIKEFTQANYKCNTDARFMEVKVPLNNNCGGKSKCTIRPHYSKDNNKQFMFTNSVRNNLNGDPAPGCNKHIEAWYTCETLEEKKTRLSITDHWIDIEINQYKTHTIECHSTAIKEIVEADYGCKEAKDCANNKFTKATNALAKQWLNEECRYKRECTVMPGYDGNSFLSISWLSDDGYYRKFERKHYIGDPKKGCDKKLFILYTCETTDEMKTRLAQPAPPSITGTSKSITIPEGLTGGTLSCEPQNITDITKGLWTGNKQALIVTQYSNVKGCVGQATCQLKFFQDHRRGNRDITDHIREGDPTMIVKDGQKHQHQLILDPAPGSKKEARIDYLCGN